MAKRSYYQESLYRQDHTYTQALPATQKTMVARQFNARLPLSFRVDSNLFPGERRDRRKLCLPISGRRRLAGDQRRVAELNRQM